MIPHIFDFIIDYFTHLNLRKIIGGVFVLIGVSLIGRMSGVSNPDKAVLLAIAGIITGGTGSVIIYYDMAKDKNTHGYYETELLNEAYKQNKKEAKKVSGWHIDDKTDKHGPAAKNERE